MIHNLGEAQSILTQYMAELRDVEIQGDPMRFRTNLRRVGAVLGYEISKTLTHHSRMVETPLGSLEMATCDQTEIVIGTILRAGLPLHAGLLSVFDRAGNAFLSAYRKYDNDNSFHIELEHLSCPSLTGKTLILSDAMLATGSSMVMAYEALCRAKGEPSCTHIAVAIACREGLDYVQRRLGASRVTLWAAGIDDEMTAKAYIVPGLGDAGDLAFGEK